MIPGPSSDQDPRPAPPRLYRAIQTIEAPLANLVGLSCRQFARLTVTRLDRPLTTTEALRHRLHGSLCGICRRFSAQFALLNDLTREIETETTPAAEAETETAAITRIAAAVRARIDKETGS